MQGANKEVPPSSICQYNLLQKSDTLLETLYHPGKVSTHLWVQKLRYRIYILYRKKKQMYIIYMAFARSIKAKIQDLRSREYWKSGNILKFSNMVEGIA